MQHVSSLNVVVVQALSRKKDVKSFSGLVYEGDDEVVSSIYSVWHSCTFDQSRGSTHWTSMSTHYCSNISLCSSETTIVLQICKYPAEAEKNKSDLLIAVAKNECGTQWGQFSLHMWQLEHSHFFGIQEEANKAEARVNKLTLAQLHALMDILDVSRGTDSKVHIASDHLTKLPVPRWSSTISANCADYNCAIQWVLAEASIDIRTLLDMLLLSQGRFSLVQFDW